MRCIMAGLACAFLSAACIEVRDQQAEPESESVVIQSQSLASADPACAGKPRGTSCPSANSDESNQCDGQGVCVDCVNHIGCNESSACDAVIQTCVNFIPPRVPQCNGAPRGAACQQPGGGSDPDYCDGFGGCIDCISDAGCAPDRYCDLFSQICLGRTAPPAPPAPLPGSTPSAECAGKASGTLCNFPGNAPEADQCDGTGVCVDCVNNGGCDESSACTPQQVCVSILDPAPLDDFRCLAEWVRSSNY